MAPALSPDRRAELSDLLWDAVFDFKVRKQLAEDGGEKTPGQVELAALVPAESGAARPNLRAFRGLRGQVGAT